MAPAAAGFVSVSSLIDSVLSGSLKGSVQYQNQQIPFCYLWYE